MINIGVKYHIHLLRNEPYTHKNVQLFFKIY